MPISSSTMLRLMHGQAIEATETPTVLGVDDFATCKGHRGNGHRGNGKTYGSILVEVEKQKVIYLLPDRQAETLPH
jgi:hypothetical protein